MITARYLLWALMSAWCLPSVVAQEWTPCAVSVFTAHKAASDAKYGAKSEYRLVLEIKSYRSAGDATPYDKGTVTIVRNGDRYRSEQFGMVILQDKKLRVVVDDGDRSIMVNEPAASDVPFLEQFSKTVFDGLASCAQRKNALGTEFKLVFASGAVYDHMIVRYDQQGWLRGTETHWRLPVPEFPDDPTSAAYTPKLVMTYGVPTTPDTTKALELDPGAVVAQRDGTLQGVGRYAGYDVFDGRAEQ